MQFVSDADDFRMKFVGEIAGEKAAEGQSTAGIGVRWVIVSVRQISVADETSRGSPGKIRKGQPVPSRI